MTRRVRLAVWALALAWATPAAAQELITGDADEWEEYDAYFGEAETPEEAPKGPNSLAEAREQGLSYRIGGRKGKHATAERQGTHIVQEGDTLWDISERYLGDPWQWPELWSYNPEITNPHWIYPLDQIRLTSNALDQDRAAQTARETGGLQEGQATQGMLAGTEGAPTVVVPPDLLTPGTVFLRDSGYLDKQALRTVGQIVSAHEEQMMLSVSDEAYVKFEHDQDVRPGQQYTIYREMHDWERQPGERGKLVKIHGTLTIRSYDAPNRYARAVITEGLNPIERGFKVAKLDRRFDIVPPKRNTASVSAKIIASVEPRELMSFGLVVFLDVGEGQGIEPGNRFFVTRKGDEWMESLWDDPQRMGNIVAVPEYEKEPLPKEVVAELRVLKVRKHTTIAIVTRSDTDLRLGDVAEMRPGY